MDNGKSSFFLGKKKKNKKTMPGGFLTSEFVVFVVFCCWLCAHFLGVFPMKLLVAMDLVWCFNVVFRSVLWFAVGLHSFVHGSVMLRW